MDIHPASRWCRPVWSLALPGVLALACDAPDLVAPAAGPPEAPAAAAPAPVRPWRMAATVQTTPADPPEGCLVYYTSVIEGTATHLGTLHGVGSTCITDAVQPDADPPFLPDGPPPYLTASFTNPRWTLVAANGDEVWMESIEAVAVISLGNGSLRARGRHRIVGGTGRFAGATGESEASAVNADGQGPDDFRGEGWIRLGRPSP